MRSGVMVGMACALLVFTAPAQGEGSSAATSATSTVCAQASGAEAAAQERAIEGAGRASASDWLWAAGWLVMGVAVSLTVWRMGLLTAPAQPRAPRESAPLWLAAALAAHLAWTLGGGLGAAAMGGADPLLRQGVVGLAAYALGLGTLAATLLAVRPVARAAGLWRAPRWGDLLTGGAALLLALPLTLGLLNLGQLVEAALRGGGLDPLAHQTLRALTDGPVAASLGWWLTTLGAALLAPIYEELLYRGMLQSALGAWLGSPGLAVGLTAAIFALAHLGGGATPGAIPALFALGAVLGLLMERRRSVWAPVVCHVGFNVLNLLLALAIR